MPPGEDRDPRIDAAFLKCVIGVVGFSTAYLAAPGLLLMKSRRQNSGWCIVFDERWSAAAEITARTGGGLRIRDNHPLSIIMDWDLEPRIGSCEQALEVARAHLTTGNGIAWYDQLVLVPETLAREIAERMYRPISVVADSS